VISLLLDALRETIIISGFVLVMMLVIEYLNILSRGWIQERLAVSGWVQYLIAALLGATPGCLGTFTVVALYAHGAVSLGAVIAAMIATTGDESFFLLALVPRTALLMMLGLAVLGVLAGMLSDRLLGARVKSWVGGSHRLVLHGAHSDDISFRAVPEYFKRPTLPRALLVGGILLIAFGIISGHLGESQEHGILPFSEAGTEAQAHAAEWGWLRVTFLIVSLMALFIVTVVPDHFLDEHLWRHILIRHLPPLLLWTFGAMLALSLLDVALRPEEWLAMNPGWLVLSAALVGIIPISGPHLIYVTAFAKGLVPFSVLLTSSLVQSGHGMLPLLAESRRAFVLIKGITFLLGLAAGAVCLSLGY
jgi:hypothetical protein